MSNKKVFILPQKIYSKCPKNPLFITLNIPYNPTLVRKTPSFLDYRHFKTCPFFSPKINGSL